MRPRAPRLDERNSKRYRPRPEAPKRAVLCWEPASYELASGTQRFEGPHMRIDAVDGPCGAELRTFFDTYRALPDRPDHYVQDAIVRALRVREELDIVTIVNGREEARATVKPGGFIVQNPGGAQYYNTPDEFQRRYEPVGEE